VRCSRIVRKQLVTLDAKYQHHELRMSAGIERISQASAGEEFHARVGREIQGRIRPEEPPATQESRIGEVAQVDLAWTNKGRWWAPLL
jgi:hypothetical protein